MQSQPLYYIDKSGITLAPQTLSLLLTYPTAFVHAGRARLEMRQPKVKSHLVLPSAHALEESTDVPNLESQLRQAETLLRELGPVQAELCRIYRWHLEQHATVWRQTRIHLGEEQIERVYSLNVALHYLMEMLKAENPLFSREKFTSFINAGGPMESSEDTQERSYL